MDSFAAPVIGRAFPILLLADLPRWQIKSRHWAAANQRDGQITSDYPK